MHDFLPLNDLMTDFDLVFGIQFVGVVLSLQLVMLLLHVHVQLILFFAD